MDSACFAGSAPTLGAGMARVLRFASHVVDGLRGAAGWPCSRSPGRRRPLRQAFSLPAVPCSGLLFPWRRIFQGFDPARLHQPVSPFLRRNACRRGSRLKRLRLGVRPWAFDSTPFRRSNARCTFSPARTPALPRPTLYNALDRGCSRRTTARHRVVVDLRTARQRSARVQVGSEASYTSVVSAASAPTPVPA